MGQTPPRLCVGGDTPRSLEPGLWSVLTGNAKHVAASVVLVAVSVAEAQTGEDLDERQA